VPTPVDDAVRGVSGSAERANSQSSWEIGAGIEEELEPVAPTKSLPSARSLSPVPGVGPARIRARSWR